MLFITYKYIIVAGIAKADPTKLYAPGNVSTVFL